MSGDDEVRSCTSEHEARVREAYETPFEDGRAVVPAGLGFVDPPKNMRLVVPVLPHEEAWYAEKQALVRKRAPDVDSQFAFLEDAVESTDAGDVARARLASAAPDMARVLLACEWADGGRCPVCVGRPSTLHDTACALDLSLRKAGVR